MLKLLGCRVLCVRFSGLGTWGSGCGLNPKGPRTQNNSVLGLKYYSINGNWALKPYYLGAWTLRVSNP